MLTSALSAVSDRLDSKFLIAYWLPAFVAVLGGFGVLALLVGAAQLDAWVYALDSVEQALAVLLVVLAVTMVAFVLRALTRPITEVFAGVALPRTVSAWLTQGQVRLKSRATRVLGADLEDLAADASDRRKAEWLNRTFPLEDGDTQPTLFGNVLATAVEHPRLAYTMEGLLWWPRLSPLVPVEFQDMLSGAQAPMLALLNLSVVFTTLAMSGAAILALAGGHGIAALVVLVGGLILARLCYRAAVSQAAEVGSLIRVGFDLYRHGVLRQMDLEIPADLAAERELWRRLTAEMLGLPQKPLSTGEDPEAEPQMAEDAAAETPS